MLKAAFIGSIVGILLLLYLSQVLEYQEYPIQDIVEKQLRGTFKATGTIAKTHSTNQTTFLTLTQQCEIDAILFLPAKLEQGQKVEVIGQKQGDELIIRRLRILP